MVRGRSTNLMVEVTTEERHTLETWQRSTAVHVRLARRGRIILMLADNASISQISRSVGIQRRFVYKWAQRFLEYGLEGLNDRYNWRNGERRNPLFNSGGPAASASNSEVA
ncbi:MAG: helix-turn-helix domain-containing protein [Dehalococcoidia bacterium]